MQVLCKLSFYKQEYVYDSVYSTVHPMKYVESDVMLHRVQYVGELM